MKKKKQQHLHPEIRHLDDVALSIVTMLYYYHNNASLDDGAVKKKNK